MNKKTFEHWQMIAILLAVYDTVAVNLSYLLALWFRYDGQFSGIPHEYLHAWLHFVPVYTVFCLVVFVLLKLYKSIWRFASYTELVRLAAASGITAVFHAVAISLLICRMPVSYYFAGALIQFMLVAGIRFSYRLVLMLHKKNLRASNADRVMLIGAGSAGQIVLRDIQRMDDINEKIVCIIDDNPNSWGRQIDGVPIVGGRENILENVEKYGIRKIYLAIPSATLEQRRDILNICQETDCELKSLPGISQLVRGEVSVTSMKDVSVEDLLGREVI